MTLERWTGADGRRWVSFDVDACGDCVTAAANGEWPDRAAELAELEAARAARPGDYVGRGAFVLEPEPLALLAPGAQLSTSTDADGDSEPSFSWAPCGACGSRLGGDRYGCTVVQPDPAVVDGAQLEGGAL